MIEKKEKFIILRKIKYSEADLILHALSQQGAKVGFLAKGALRSKKRFGGGVLEPTHFVLLTYKERQNSDGESSGLRLLQEAQIVDDFAGIRQDYERLETALAAVEAVYKVSQEGDIDSDGLFNLLGHMLRAASKSENSNSLFVLKIHFYLKLLLQQGVLTPEPWMAPYLRLPLSESRQLLSYLEESKSHWPILELSIREYLQRAETDFFSPKG